MKYQSSNTKQVYEQDFPKLGRYRCPECAEGSKRKNPKDLQYYGPERNAYCHKCETSLFPYKPYSKTKTYELPERKNNTACSDEVVKYWESRMISKPTLIDLGVYTDVEYMPQFGKEVRVMCFPFFRGGELVNIKYRGPQKSFKLVPGAELTWYNFDALENNEEIIICEGEGEVFTMYENGFKNVISVPNGAGGNLEFLDGTISLFEQKSKVYLATDNDRKGIELRDELARRIGAEKCYIINFRECKDGNEFFTTHGGIEFKKLIPEARPVPVKGVVMVKQLQSEIVDLWQHGVQKGKEIGMLEIDKYSTWELGRLATVTGVPGSGKSELIDFLTTKLNLIHGWKVAYFTPENYPLKFHYAKLHEKLSGKKFQSDTEAGFWSVYEHIRDNFFYILNEDDFTVDMVLDRAKMLVKQHGVKVLVLDPYNRFEHGQKASESETQYISTFLDKLTMFAKVNDVLVFLVAHPRKMQRGEVPTLYDIAGSAHFYNKTDYGFCVHRVRDSHGLMTNEIAVYWQKIRFKHLGEQGMSELRYNYNNGRFEPRVDVNQWDNSCWLKPQIEVQEFNQKKENNEVFDGTTRTDRPPF